MKKLINTSFLYLSLHWAIIYDREFTKFNPFYRKDHLQSYIPIFCLRRFAVSYPGIICEH